MKWDTSEFLAAQEANVALEPFMIVLLVVRSVLNAVHSRQRLVIQMEDSS